MDLLDLLINSRDAGLVSMSSAVAWAAIAKAPTGIFEDDLQDDSQRDIRDTL